MGRSSSGRCTKLSLPHPDLFSGEVIMGAFGSLKSPAFSRINKEVSHVHRKVVTF